jgi:hypothetical protein
MKTVAILSALVSVVAAQTSSFIPTSGVSDTCKAYLAQLDGNTSLKSCTSALAGATSAFSSSSGGGSAAVSSSLSNLCGNTIDGACSTTTMGKVIAEIFAACQKEINSNDQVKMLFDTVYVMGPFRKALCAKDDSGRSCATQIPKSNGLVAGGVAPSNAQKYIASTNGAVSTVNATTFTNQNVPFLFISQDSDASTLCTTCTRNIFTAYADWETQVPYAPGISQSKLLQSQNNIYSAIKSKCPSNFLSSSGVQAAGAAGKGIGSGLLNGAERTASGAASALIGGALLAVVAMAL